MPSLLAKTAKNLLWLAVGPFLASCATPNSEPSYYEPPPLSSETSARPAIIEGTLEQIHMRGGLPSVLYEPHRSIGFALTCSRSMNRSWVVEPIAELPYRYRPASIGSRHGFRRINPLLRTG